MQKSAPYCFFILISIAFLSIVNPACGEELIEKTYVIITVDHCFTYEGIIDAKLSGQDVGLKAIVDICDKHDVIPVFFVSPYDTTETDPDPVKNVVQYLDARGCEVQLHTHPAWYFDRNRTDLYQYTLEEQIEIIRFGKDKLVEWTGKQPIAHRAGDYGADTNTMIALKKNGFIFDSSMFFKHPSCKLDNTELPINAVGKLNGIIQIPVSSFVLVETSPLFKMNFPPVKRIRKIDIDWADYDQLGSGIDALNAAGIRTITLFLHFHTFFKSRDNLFQETDELDAEDIEEFDSILAYIQSNPKLEFATFGSLGAMIEETNADLFSGDALPEYRKEVSLLSYLRKKAGITRENVLYYGVACVLILTICSLLLKKRFSKKA